MIPFKISPIKPPTELTAHEDFEFSMMLDDLKCTKCNKDGTLKITNRWHVLSGRLICPSCSKKEGAGQ